MTRFPTLSDAPQSGIGMPTEFNEDFELYEDDDKFVLTLEMPGFEADDITVAWDAGVLNVGAQQTDEKRGRERTFHRRFRFPKKVNDDNAHAEYNNGILEITLPVSEGAVAAGRKIPIEA